ncbi:MAG: hypothetical protein ACTHYR_04315 [Brachybacterium sp.]
MTARTSLADRVLETIDGYLIIETPPCMHCGCYGSIALTPEQHDLLEGGAFIQDAAPELSDPVREQFISGTHPKCWDSLFGW